MPDRYHEGDLTDWEVTATVTVPALNEAGAIHAAQHLLEVARPGYADDWTGRRA